MLSIYQMRLFLLVNVLNQSDAYSTRPIWWHYVGIAIPDEIKYPNAAVLLIQGGSNTDTELVRVIWINFIILFFLINFLWFNLLILLYYIIIHVNSYF